jgi:hypothetical protein
MVSSVTGPGGIESKKIENLVLVILERFSINKPQN